MRPMAHGNHTMKRNAITDQYIGRAREMAAQGGISYRNALDAVARDEGFGSWSSYQNVMEGLRDEAVFKTMTARQICRCCHDGFLGMFMLVMGSDLERYLDIKTHRLMHFVLKAFGSGWLVTPRTLSRILPSAAVICLVAGSVGAVMMARHHHPIGGYADAAQVVVPYVILSGIWLASRWMISQRDPVRSACKTVRTNALIFVMIATLFPAALITKINGTDLNALAIVTYVAQTMASLLWVAAMYAGAESGEVQHGR